MRRAPDLDATGKCDLHECGGAQQQQWSGTSGQRGYTCGNGHAASPFSASLCGHRASPATGLRRPSQGTVTAPPAPWRYSE
eukprot:gene22516-60324_t